MNTFFRCARNATFVVLLCLFSLIAHAQSNPLPFNLPSRPTAYFIDMAGVVGNEKNEIEARLRQLANTPPSEGKVGVQLSVVIVPSLGNEDIFDAAQRIATQWGIGERDKDNGALFLIAIEDRKFRLHLGYGLESVIPDSLAARWLDERARPRFREADYAGGILSIIDAFQARVAHGEVGVSTTEATGQNFLWGNLFFFLTLFWIVGHLVWRFFSISKAWWHGGVFFGLAGALAWWVVGMGIVMGILTIIGAAALGLLLDYYASKHPPRKGRGGWDMWIFPGGSSGGWGGNNSSFGGFGGGNFGGGGAEGDW